MNDEEAKFKLEIFALFQPKNLDALLRQESEESEGLAIEFARFIAAYFLNFEFPKIFVSPQSSNNRTAKRRLPNLLQWSQWNEECIQIQEGNVNMTITPCYDYNGGCPSNSVELDAGLGTCGRERLAGWGQWRQQIAQLLPPEYTPGFALRLLLRLGALLESVFFCDYFNDFRASLILRFLVDRLTW